MSLSLCDVCKTMGLIPILKRKIEILFSTQKDFDELCSFSEVFMETVPNPDLETVTSFIIQLCAWNVVRRSTYLSNLKFSFLSTINYGRSQ